MLLKKELIVNFQNQSRFCRKKRKWKELKIHSHWLLCVKESIGSHSTHIEVSKGRKKNSNVAIKINIMNILYYMWMSRLKGKEMFAEKRKKSVSIYVWVMKTGPYRIIHPKRYPFSAAACLPKQNPLTHMNFFLLHLSV